MQSLKERVQNFKKELPSLIVLVLAIFAFRWSVAEPYVVPTGSMEPTILPGDRLVVFKSYYDLRLPFTNISLAHFKDPRRGDVIVFRYPVDPSIDFVKRLVGLPGDTIDVVDGVIQLNGKPLSLKDADTRPPGARTNYQGFPLQWKYEVLGDVTHIVQRIQGHIEPLPTHQVVPADSYFFMGDNRDNSSDSRVWGFVPKANLKGRAVLIWLSFDPEESFFSPDKYRFRRIGNKL